MSSKNKQHIDNFLGILRTHRIKELAARTTYPLLRTAPLPAIKNGKELEQYFNELFDDSILQVITQSRVPEDWSEMGYRGLMLFDGLVWLDEDGHFYGLNYETALAKKKRESLKNLEKRSLHPSVQNFENPLHVLKTPTYTLRLDDLGNNNVRLAVWPINAGLNTKPQLLLYHGIYVADGSGGNHSYLFKNGEFQYEVGIQVMGEDDATKGTFLIKKKNKVVVSQVCR